MIASPTKLSTLSRVTLVLLFTYIIFTSHLVLQLDSMVITDEGAGLHPLPGGGGPKSIKLQGSLSNYKKKAKPENEDVEPILDILRHAGYDLNNKSLFNEDLLSKLPKWSDIVNFYGPPRILGLETCKQYQERPSSTKKRHRRVGIAGTFNSGTNLLNNLLESNCRLKPDSQDNLSYVTNNTNLTKIGKAAFSGVHWQVHWGKHVPPSERGKRIAEKAKPYKFPFDDLLPVVSVRDPMTWMQSMCNQNYQAQFDHDKNFCPNIIPYETDIESHPRYKKMKYLPVWVKYSIPDLIVKHDSLPHMWNEWYQEYVNATFPRLIVRMEDLLFHAQEIVPQICKCYGAYAADEFVHHAETSNQNHGIDTNATSLGLLRGIIKYGNITNRRKGYPPFQIKAANDILDPKLMELFGYKYEEI